MSRKKKLKLGKIQKQWIENLREYPERQLKGSLGYKAHSRKVPYRVCCLGELLLVKRRLHKIRLFSIHDGRLEEDIIDHRNQGSLIKSYKSLGLHNHAGEFRDENDKCIKFSGYDDLADMNDHGKTWPEIADFVEENPEVVFCKSV